MQTTDVEELFRSLMTVEITDAVSASEALEHVGVLIDISSDLDRPEGTRRAIELASRLLDRGPSPGDAALLNYFAANAWAHLWSTSHRIPDSIWDWELPEIESQLIHLRCALTGPGFPELPDIRQCQIATNFGNLLSQVGRFVEAIEYWDRALRVDRNFAMALGNRGQGLIQYGRTLYDDGHAPIFFRRAHVDLSAGLAEGVGSQATVVFEKLKRSIEKRVSEAYLRDGTDMEGLSLGESGNERRYRRWCLENRLFLNPLNDLGAFPIAARDVFSVPSIAVSLGEGPTYHGFFNQLKQEFVSARFTHYDGITTKKPHFADKDVLLLNTLDYPAYSLAVEKVKMAFRMAYSLFDKIAFFLNDYLRLGISANRVTFRTIWYEKPEKKVLRPLFQTYKNWPFRGLFWLSKDLYEDKPGFREAIEPDARQLNEIRNHAEHKYLKLHEGDWSPELAVSNASDGMGDRLAYSVDRDDFEAKALRILKHARAALIYLSLGVHCEEQRRKSEKGDDSISVPLYLTTFDDEWKT